MFFLGIQICVSCAVSMQIYATMHGHVSNCKFFCSTQ